MWRYTNGGCEIQLKLYFTLLWVLFSSRVRLFCDNSNVNLLTYRFLLIGWNSLAIITRSSLVTIEAFAWNSAPCNAEQAWRSELGGTQIKHCMLQNYYCFGGCIPHPSTSCDLRRPRKRSCAPSMHLFREQPLLDKCSVILAGPPQCSLPIMLPSQKNYSRSPDHVS